MKRHTLYRERAGMAALVGVAAMALALPSAAMADDTASAAPAATNAPATAAPDTSASPTIVANAGTPSAATTKATSQPNQAMRGSHSDRVEARIKELRTKLKITANEEDQWNAVVQVMRDNARAMDDLIQARRANTNAMTALDDVKAYSEMADARAEGVKKFVAAFEPLYTSMSDAQKKVADQLFNANNARNTRLAGRSSGRGS